MSTMKALYYNAPRDFTIKEVLIPEINDDEILIKVSCCGVCGTDGHIHEGEFISKFPLVPGHEFVGPVEKVGKNVKDIKVGQRVVSDVGVTCGKCYFCRRGETLYCEKFDAHGVTISGGFAEYVKVHHSKAYQIHNLTDEEATLLEPASCAVHGIDKLQPTPGVEVLLIGAGPTGLILAQLLKLNGASKVTIAANEGLKMEIAEKMGAADEYIKLSRDSKTAETQWEKIKKDNPYGFDIVAECTGVEKIVNDSINYVKRGGKLLVYGVYENKARVQWPPSKIFGDEIKIIGSFSQTFCFPRAVAYLDSGKVNVKGMVTDVYNLEDYQQALDKMNSRKCLKIAIRPQK